MWKRFHRQTALPTIARGNTSRTEPPGGFSGTEHSASSTEYEDKARSLCVLTTRLVQYYVRKSIERNIPELDHVLARLALRDEKPLKITTQPGISPLLFQTQQTPFPFAFGT